MNTTGAPVPAPVTLHCYDNVVDVSDETITETSTNRMDHIRKVVLQRLPFLSRNSNGGHDSQSATYGSTDVFYIHIPSNSNTVLLNSSHNKHSVLELKSPAKRNRVHKPHSSGTEVSDDKDYSPTTLLLDEELPETEDDEMVKYTCRHLNAFDIENALRDAKSVSKVPDGSVLIADFLSNTVILFEASGKATRSYFMERVSEPWAAVMTADGHVAVTLQRQGCLTIWSKDGKSMEMFGQDILQSPCGLAVDERGRLIVTDERQNDVFVFERSGQCLHRLTEINDMSFKQPRYVCCSSSGRIIVSDSGNHCIKVFNQDGQFLIKFGSFGSENGKFKFPYGVCVDDKNNIIVADHYNRRVVMFSENGKFVQNLLTSCMGLKCPYDVCLDCTNGSLMYVTHGELRASKAEVFEVFQ